MAKNRTPFQVSPEDFNETRVTNGGIGDQQPDDVVLERKKRQIHILTYESLVNRVDALAKRKGLSRAQLFEKMATEYLDKNNA